MVMPTLYPYTYWNNGAESRKEWKKKKNKQRQVLKENISVHG